MPRSTAKKKKKKFALGKVGQVGEPSKSTEEADLLGLTAVSSREPWKALGWRHDSWTLRKQDLSLLEQCRWPSEHTRHECAGSWCKCLLCAGELLCCDSAPACASVCQVAACPRSMLHVPASEVAGHWGVGCMRVVCGHVCQRVHAGPWGLTACVCTPGRVRVRVPPPPGLPRP